MKLRLALITLPALLAASAHAVVTFTVDLTITSADGSAFSIGENVTVTLTTIEGLGAPNKQNDAGGVEWSYTAPLFDPGVEIFSNITVSGTTGVAASDFVELYSELSSGPSVGSSATQDRFFLYLEESGDNGFDLFRNGEEINYFDFGVEPASLVSAIYASNPLATPESTFVNGTYDLSAATGSPIFFYTDGFSNEYTGTANSLTVTGAVPEPSAWASALGLMALICVWRRRRA